MSIPTTKRIAQLNDAFRQGGPLTACLGGAPNGSGRWMHTAGVQSLPADTIARIVQAVRGFDRFTPDNDPYGEHDFGAFRIDGYRLFWKIDYYDHALEYGSPDPADPSATCRVLTVMLAEEY
ncbi:hypothetical protein J3E64_001556 [Sphingobium sp. OAS761]|uniref:DUF3768 domain-containing protein n=1 Tax=Sphingobium sp. OAS761 TaxID=2817901 RepID=UPI0034601A1E|nr:hypothetical protein [Sphingobium sp. OAS761]